MNDQIKSHFKIIGDLEEEKKSKHVESQLSEVSFEHKMPYSELSRPLCILSLCLVPFEFGKILVFDNFIKQKIIKKKICI